MSLLAGITIGLFRETHDGRRVLGVRPAGFRTAWYLVSDSEVPVVERRFRQFYAGVFLALLPAVIVFSGSNWWLIAALVLVMPFAMRYWVLRGLPRAAVADEDLIPIDRKAQLLEQAQAFGQPTMWVLMIAVILMGALGLSVAIADGVWWAWLGVAMFGTMAVIMARQILMTRRTRR
jgi:hypothetical protein